MINALNRDLPYDQFVIDQIAGDVLPNATQDQIVATGFLRNSMINEEGGIDPEQFRMEAMFDRMDAIGKSILGVTIQCAQCHNHKFDPLTQEEYYRHVRVSEQFARSERRRLYAARADEARRHFPAHSGNRSRYCSTAIRTGSERMAAWEEKVKADQPEWTVVRPEVDDISTGGQRYLPHEGWIVCWRRATRRPNIA